MGKATVDEAKLDKVCRVFKADSVEALVGKAVDAEEAGSKAIAREQFPRLVRMLYKVVKEIVITDKMLIEQSKQLRRMEVGEVMEVVQGPALDPTMGIYRIAVRAMQDGLEGWVTVAGTAGMTFLTPCACIFRCAKTTPLTPLKDASEGVTPLKELKEGQILEFLEWGRALCGSSSVARIKVRVLKCGTVGWRTTTGPDGTLYTTAA